MIGQREQGHEQNQAADKARDHCVADRRFGSCLRTSSGRWRAAPVGQTARRRRYRCYGRLGACGGAILGSGHDATGDLAIGFGVRMVCHQRTSANW
jgi:hypothetical protein